MGIIIGPDSNKYFIGQSELQVNDGDTADADDVNALTQKTNAALDLVEADILGLSSGNNKAQEWASNDQGVKPEPTGDYYSARANAIETADWAKAGSGVSIKLADGTTSAEPSAKTSATEAKASQVAAASSETNATASATAAGTSETNAATSATDSQLKAWEAEAEKMTADSFGTEAEDVFVKSYSSNGDGTFSVSNLAEYSSFHWSEKSKSGSSGITSIIATAPIVSDNADPTTPVLSFSGTKSDVGLASVDNTADLDKPVSGPTQVALDLKADGSALTSHTGDTSNPHTVTKLQVGLGNAENTADLDKPVSTATQSSLDLKADTTALDLHAASTANPHVVTKTQVGLGNADNTSDLDKPVSDATQIAIDAVGGGGGLAWELLAADVTAVADTGYLVDASVSRTVTLPLGVEGATVGVSDYLGTCGVNNINIAADGTEKIMGLAEVFLLDIDEASVILVYTDAANGWQITGGTW